MHISKVIAAAILSHCIVMYMYRCTGEFLCISLEIIKFPVQI